MNINSNYKFKRCKIEQRKNSASIFIPAHEPTLDYQFHRKIVVSFQQFYKRSVFAPKTYLKLYPAIDNDPLIGLGYLVIISQFISPFIWTLPTISFYLTKC